MRVEQIGSCTLYLADCMDILPTLGKVDAVVTDPPYGIDWKPRVNHQNQKWIDKVDFSVEEIATFSKEATIWGAEYLAPKLPPSKSWLTWVKRPVNSGDFSADSRTYATTELAWSNVGKSAFFVLVWDGGMRSGQKDNRTFCHPSQKPVELMEWCIARHSNAKSVLDPFMGSGTTGVACVNLGRKFIGIEKEPEYFDIACERIQQAVNQPKLFNEKTPDPVQGELV